MSPTLNRGASEIDDPLVTVIVTCYNHARFVQECLDGIRGQTYSNIQLIIADDCSTDNSVERIRAWVDDHGIECHLLLHDRNMGLCRTLNEALSMASGKYVAIVSADDIWVPEKTERQVEMMEALPETVAVVYSDAYVIDETGRRLPGLYMESRVRRFDAPEGDVFPILLRDWCFIPAMTTLIRRSCLETVGPYDEALVMEDVDMWLRLARHYRFAFDRNVAASYRILPNSLFRSRQTDITKSFIRLFSKWLAEPEFAPVAKKRIAEEWWTLTQLEPENRWRHAHAALRTRQDLRAFAKLLCLTLGIPFDHVSRVPGARSHGSSRPRMSPRQWKQSYASSAPRRRRFP